MNTSLSFRLIGFYSLVATVTAFFTLWIGDMIVERQMLRGTDFLLDAEFEEIHEYLEGVAPPLTAERVSAAIVEHTMIDASMFFFQVDAADGAELFRSRNLGERSLGGGGGHLGKRSAELDSHHENEGRIPIRVGEFHHGDLRVKIATSLTAHRVVSRQFHTLMAAAVPSVFLLSLAVGYLLSQVMLKPLRAMQASAQRISATNLKERIPIPASRDELTRLAELLNSTFDRLEKSFEQIRRFTADSSHELKTPLTVVRLQAEKVLESESLAPDHRVALTELLGEVTRLEKVINGLLLLARAEAEALPLDRRELSTAEYLEGIAEDAETLADSEGRRFRVVVSEDRKASFDPSWVRQVLFNLLSNALKHSPPEGEILLSSTHLAQRWRIVLEDQGPGVPPDRLEAIFERFMTSDGEKSGGTGLGLAVCRSIVELHGGSIHAEARSAELGFRIVIELPHA